MFNFIYYIFTDIDAHLGFKFIYLIEKIIKYPLVLSNRYLKTNFQYPFLIREDFYIKNSDWIFLIKAKSWNDYAISTCQEYDFRKYFFTIQDNKIFLDIWAHIGKWSILLANKKNIKTYCFEPNPESYKYLVENIKLNKLENKITSLNYWVSEKSWEMKFHIHNESTMSWLVLENSQDSYTKSSIISVKTISIDTFIKDKQLNIQDIGLIKIDVEGYEKGVIEWMKNLLENTSPDLKIICEITSNDKDIIINKICSYWFSVQAIWVQDYFFSKK